MGIHKTAAPIVKRQQRFRIVLVGPEYGLNVGAVARAMKNFGFSDLAIVSPRCDPRGFDAIKYSKHARDVLESARICKSVKEAARGCKFIVGTTGVIYRHWHQTIRSPISLELFAKKAAKEKRGGSRSFSATKAWGSRKRTSRPATSSSPSRPLTPIQYSTSRMQSQSCSTSFQPMPRARSCQQASGKRRRLSRHSGFSLTGSRQ